MIHISLKLQYITSYRPINSHTYTVRHTITQRRGIHLQFTSSCTEGSFYLTFLLAHCSRGHVLVMKSIIFISIANTISSWPHCIPVYRADVSTGYFNIMILVISLLLSRSLLKSINTFLHAICFVNLVRTSKFNCAPMHRCLS